MNQMDDELFKGIEDLPDEVLLMVFENLDFKTLMASTLVCKKWNEVIGQNTAIMKKIKLVFTLYGELDMAKDLTRSYHTIEISEKYTGFLSSEIAPSYLVKSWDKIFQTTEQYARNLRVLIMEQCHPEMIETKKFNKMFAALTNLESLNISITKFFPSNTKIDLSPLVRLKSLSLNYDNDYNIAIRKFPGTTQLKSLQVDSLKYPLPLELQIMFEQNYESSECLIDFLARQKSLEDLTIINSNVTCNYNREKLNAIEFPLKRLALYNYNNMLDKMSYKSDENLLLFMSKFVNSLEELYIHRTFPESFYEMIFTKFRKLKALWVFVYAAPKDEAFYRRVQPNTSIQKLIFNSVLLRKNTLRLTEEPLKGFIGNLPNIQTLDLKNINFSEELLTFISYNLIKLVNLEVSSISHHAFVRVTIPSLKSLSVKNLFHDKPINWKDIVRATPNIEVFAVLLSGFESLLNEEKIKIMAKGWPQLRHVKFGCRFVASKEMFDLFLFNFKNLRIVECFDSAFKTIPNMENLLLDYKRNGLTFIIRPYFWDTSFKTKNYFHKNWEKTLTQNNGC